MEKIYSTAVTATGGRNGFVKSADNVLDVEVKMPKELGGPAGKFLNPETFFAAGFAACFDSALNMIIRTEKIKTGTTSVTAEVDLLKKDDGAFALGVVLAISIPDVARALAEELAHKAHQVCPYSNATRGNITVDLLIK